MVVLIQLGNDDVLFICLQAKAGLREHNLRIIHRD